MCGMQLVGEPLIPNEAGWVTNAASACVGLAVETELQDLYVSGAVQELINKYRPIAKCPSQMPDGQGLGDDAIPLDLEDIGGLFIVYICGLVALIIAKMFKGHCIKHTQWYRNSRDQTNGKARNMSESIH